jgi:SpoU rRNA methylase family enzyme
VSAAFDLLQQQRVAMGKQERDMQAMSRAEGRRALEQEYAGKLAIFDADTGRLAQALLDAHKQEEASLQVFSTCLKQVNKEPQSPCGQLSSNQAVAVFSEVFDEMRVAVRRQDGLAAAPGAPVPVPFPALEDGPGHSILSAAMQLSTQHAGAGAYIPGDGGGDPHETKLTKSGANKGHARATCGARIRQTGAVGVTDPRMMAAQESQEQRQEKAEAKKVDKAARKAGKQLTLLTDLERAAEKLRSEEQLLVVTCKTCKTYLTFRLACAELTHETQVVIDCKAALKLKDGLIQAASLRVLQNDSQPAALPLPTAPRANLAKRPASPAPTAPGDNGKRPRRGSCK